jgi:poly-gamma-glutamate synthesis protein (capsule biosynthesis protein)
VEMVPFRRRRMRLEIAASADLDWLQLLMNREGGPLGTRVRRIGDRSLELSWWRCPETGMMLRGSGC